MSKSTCCQDCAHRKARQLVEKSGMKLKRKRHRLRSVVRLRGARKIEQFAKLLRVAQRTALKSRDRYVQANAQKPKRRVRRRLRSVVGLPDFEKTMKAIDSFEKRSRKVCLVVGLAGLRYMQALERKANAAGEASLPAGDKP